jgi:folate-binding protein YgfZ
MKDAYEALHSGAGVLARPELHTLRLDGPDRVRFLNGMVTNDVTRLVPGAGQRSVKTNNRGRVEGLLRVRAEADALWIDVLETSAARVCGVLDRFIIMDDCAIRDVSDTRRVLSLLGPEALRVAASAGLAPEVELPVDGFAPIPGGVAVRDESLGVSGLELHLEPAAAERALSALVEAGAVPVDREVVELLRVERGVPLDGVDVDEDTIPMEARLDAMISSDKGCYVGQEVIARATIQGQVAHLLVGLRLPAGAEPGALVGAELLAEDDKRIGEISSAVRSPRFGPIALGYAKRRWAEPGTRLRVAGQTVEVVALPFSVAP